MSALIFSSFRRIVVHCAWASSVARPSPILALRVGLLHPHRQQRLTPEFFVVVQVLIPQGQSVHALRHQFRDRVLDPRRLAMVAERGRKLSDDPGALLHLPQQQTPGVAGDRSAIKPTSDFALP